MNTDDVIRGLILVLLLIAFLGMVAWAWSKNRDKDFEMMSRLPLDEDDAQIHKAQTMKKQER